jgi:hypothetical protein
VTHDRQQIAQLAREYTEAWCSRDPARVAAHYAPGGTIAINGGETGKSVRIPGFEEWTIDADCRIAESLGHYDQAEYDRQLREGASAG